MAKPLVVKAKIKRLIIIKRFFITLTILWSILSIIIIIFMKNEIVELTYSRDLQLEHNNRAGTVRILKGVDEGFKYLTTGSKK